MKINKYAIDEYIKTSETDKFRYFALYLGTNEINDEDYYEQRNGYRHYFNGWLLRENLSYIPTLIQVKSIIKSKGFEFEKLEEVVSSPCLTKYGITNILNSLNKFI